MAGTLANIVRQPLATLVFNSVDLGFTYSPFELSSESSYLTESNEQLMGYAFKQLMSRNYKWKTELHEGSLSNLCLGFGQPASAVSAGTLTLNDTEVAAASLVATGKAGTGPSNKVRTVTLPQAAPTGNTTIVISKNASARVPLEGDAISDGTKYGTVVDV